MPDDYANSSDTNLALTRALRLARISLAFGRVERVTRHEDGVRAETDTDHTVMLGLVACELAPANLDRARIAAFALVHDLAEVYAGDTQTLVVTPDAMAAKRDREESARRQLATELGAGSWVAETMATYERQCVPEARFVRLVDKILPKLTHAFNGCAAAKALTDREGFHRSHANQLHDLSAKYPEFVDALALLRAAMQHSESCWSDESARRETTIHDALRDSEKETTMTTMNDYIPTPAEVRAAPPPDVARAIRQVLDALRGGETRYVIRCDDWPPHVRVQVERRLSAHGWDVRYDDGLHGSEVIISEQTEDGR